MNPDNARVRLGTRAPNLEDVLPYPYAHNLAHGTPLYKSVPARDDMAEIEPYLNIEVSPERAAKRAAAEAKGKGDKGAEKADSDHQTERTAKHDKKGKKRRKKKKAEAVETESSKKPPATRQRPARHRRPRLLRPRPPPPPRPPPRVMRRATLTQARHCQGSQRLPLSIPSRRSISPTLGLPMPRRRSPGGSRNSKKARPPT